LESHSNISRGLRIKNVVDDAVTRLIKMGFVFIQKDMQIFSQVIEY